jgi:hypothetical protein
MDSIMTANDVRHLIAALVEKLYANDDAIAATKKLDIEDIVDELSRLSSVLVLNAVEDAANIEREA